MESRVEIFRSPTAAHSPRSRTDPILKNEGISRTVSIES